MLARRRGEEQRGAARGERRGSRCEASHTLRPVWRGTPLGKCGGAYLRAGVEGHTSPALRLRAGVDRRWAGKPEAKCGGPHTSPSLGFRAGVAGHAAPAYCGAHSCG
eukprot:349923-Chlamydomonas_euryale.AAC.6